MCRLWKALLNVAADFDSLPLPLCQNLGSVAAIHRLPLDNAIGWSRMAAAVILEVVIMATNMVIGRMN